jgi:alpha-glucosidase (family GH31 glycosyl hydrolase)
MVGRIIQRTYFRYWSKRVWNDMNEPVMEVPNKTFPMDVRHDYDGNPCSHRKAHNIYGTQMARATYHGVKRFAYPKDLLLLRDQLMGRILLLMDRR